MTTRRQRLRELLLHHADGLDGSLDVADLRAQREVARYVLVERNLRRRSVVYLSLNPAPEAAAEYQLRQESDEWTAEYLVDLDTGVQMVPQPSLAWASPDAMLVVPTP